MQLDKIEDIIEDIRLGKMVVLIDDEDRENEGDLVMAAQHVKAEHINFMARFARGLICMPMSKSQAERLGLRLMVEHNGSGFGTKFTASIEAAKGVSTGISAADRALTVQAAAAHSARAEDIVQPGHIFPLIAEPGGVLVRAGHTEASCDLARLAGLNETGVICEVMNEDGSMARLPELIEFAKEHGLRIGTIADLIHYRAVNEATIERLYKQSVMTDHGQFMMHAYRDCINGDIHLALTQGELDGSATLVRVQQSVCLRDLLGIQIPGSSGWNIQRCLARISAEKKGVLVLLAGAESSSDMKHKIDALSSMSKVPRASADGDPLMIGVGSQILRDLGLGDMRLMASPAKYHGISGFNLQVSEYVVYR
ncbi:3,4-dihydroxy-2-butanone-4-phosphate synthase [Pseudomonas taiwanensis]|uniref:bifunctional 3,4-dihydroxy-2-butanone-4-phosphate synthase/GTP cyclohydrolase II n=1 Tax=Pseudomonas TaxID=286 RepID=UPI0015BEE94E|nr:MULTISPECIES: bifunctional 3,4-dihydroxy-2-butanone-4-phosphate synthase/GTP cyclohydrolase II [Pseudomonas]MDH4560778.1 3,4-dihydroxy-2-butanone-4-phosphate synthase [Pseudomonas sp. BN411]MDH4653730.1 3,4-dihydroxy-2-butanone-4-phosphate synthase [Pseudomonas sp. BN606]MDH4874127.1 3,4-dihydroxy-2-butanone-4-phosphate synthase [Pseudomonas sp. BN515]NWL75759.1 3,4-dihydroxy-2-butanone-4-phosphate synthase [Pseudomonas taiwanensis]